MSYYLIESHVRQKVNEKGKRIGATALSVLDAFIDLSIDRALEIHNGGRKTIDGTVMRVALTGTQRAVKT